MAKIWRYVLAHDGGRAPCIDGGMLTLCCCKPVIRKGAGIGDWVIGLAPKRFGVGLVAWAGQVAKVLPMGAYGEQFSERQDAIYRVSAIAADGKEMLDHVGGHYHNTAKQRSTDASGLHCLIFSPFWYFGRQARTLPMNLLGLTHYHVGQTSRGSDVELALKLQAWLSQWPAGVSGRPRDAVGTQSCSMRRASF